MRARPAPVPPVPVPPVPVPPVPVQPGPSRAGPGPAASGWSWSPGAALRFAAGRRRGSPARREADRVEDLLVAGTAAQVPGAGLADLGGGGLRSPAQQVIRGDDQARRAETTLHRASVDVRLLHGV